MKKVIAIISEDPRLVEITHKHEKCHAHFNQKIEFLEKQAMDAQESYNKSCDILKAETEERLRDIKKLPSDYNTKTHHIHVDSDTGVIYTCPNESHAKSKNPLDAILAALLSKKD